MSKKPDVKGIAGKFSLSKIMNNIAEVVDSNSKISDVDPSDSIGKKIQDIDNTVQEMHQSQQEHTNNLARVDQLLKDLYQDLQALRQQVGEGKSESTEQSAAKEASSPTNDDEPVAASSASEDKSEPASAPEAEAEKSDGDAK